MRAPLRTDTATDSGASVAEGATRNAADPLVPDTMRGEPRQGVSGLTAVRGPLLALLLYGALTLLLFPTVVWRLGDSFPGDLGDPPSQAWILAWDTHALATTPGRLYDGNIFYPFHDVLAYQDTLLGLLPVAAPLVLLTGNPALAYNVLFLLSFALCAWGAYLLARRLVGDPRAAFLAGLVYGFSPYRMVHLYHLNLLCAMWVPFALLCWERVRSGHARSWVGVGLFVVLQALSALYYAAFLAVALALLLALEALHRALTPPALAPLPTPSTPWDPTPSPGRGRGERTRLLPLSHAPGEGVRVLRGGAGSLVFGAVLTAAGCLAVLYPFFAPYARVERQLGGSRGLGQAVHFAADARDFLHNIDLSVLYGWTGRALGVRPDDALQYLWPGAVTLGLAAWGLWAARASVPRRGRPLRSATAAAMTPTTAPALNQQARVQRGYAVLGVVATVLCLGPVLKMWGAWTGLPLPYLLLYQAPGFAGLRDPARFGAIYGLCLAVLAAYGATALLARLRSVRALWGQAGAVVLCTGVLAESWLRPLPVVAVPVGAALPPVYRWLAAQPAGRAVLELPIGLGDKTVWAEQAQMMYAATYHWHPIVNGTGGFAPPGYDHDVPLYNSFPSPAALHLLDRRRVTYVIVHRAWVGIAAANAIRTRVGALHAHGASVRLIAQWPDTDAYEL